MLLSCKSGVAGTAVSTGVSGLTAAGWADGAEMIARSGVDVVLTAVDNDRDVDVLIDVSMMTDFVPFFFFVFVRRTILSTGILTVTIWAIAMVWKPTVVILRRRYENISGSPCCAT